MHARQELHFCLSKLKLVRIESASSFASDLQETADAEEVLLNVVVVHNAVVHAGEVLALECCHDVSLAVSVGVTRTEESLRSSTILISSPWC